MIKFIAFQFEVDVIVMNGDTRPKKISDDSEGSSSRGFASMSEEIRAYYEFDAVDVVDMEASDGAHDEANCPLTMKKQRFRRMQDYFFGARAANDFKSNLQFLTSPGVCGTELFSRPFEVHYANFPLSEVNLLRYAVERDENFKRPHSSSHKNGGDPYSNGEKLVVKHFDRKEAGQLLYTALGVIRATGEDDLEYANLAGYVIVTDVNVEENNICVAMPDRPPLA